MAPTIGHLTGRKSQVPMYSHQRPRLAVGAPQIYKSIQGVESRAWQRQLCNCLSGCPQEHPSPRRRQDYRQRVHLEGHNVAQSDQQ